MAKTGVEETLANRAPKSAQKFNNHTSIQHEFKDTSDDKPDMLHIHEHKLFAAKQVTAISQCHIIGNDKARRQTGGKGPGPSQFLDQ